MGSKRKLLPQVLAGSLIIALGVIGTVALIKTKPKVKKVRVEVKPPLVSVIRVDPAPVVVWVRSEGEVRPVLESQLTSQVAGRVEMVSPSFVVGGMAKKGDVLVSVERNDYEVAAALAEANLKGAEARLQELLEESRVSREEWSRYFSDGENPPPLLVKEPQIKAAKAELDAARAQLEKAKLDLERTVIRAPFDCLVAERYVGPGDYLTPGKPVGKVYDVSEAEVVVYLSDSEVGLVYVPGYNSGNREGSLAKVHLSVERGHVVWNGRVVRTGGAVDVKTRMIPVIIEVPKPFSKEPPLLPGSFVTVEIEGKRLSRGAVLPDYAVRWGSDGEPLIWIVDDESRLRFRKVEVALFREGKVYVESGLRSGDLVVTTPLKTVTEGMLVRVSRAGENR